MSRKAAASAMDLILRKIRIASSVEIGEYVRPFSNFSSNFRNSGRRDEPFSPKSKRIDFSLVKTLDDSVKLFDDIVRRYPQPSVRVYNKLLSVTAKMEEYSFVLHMFDEMRRMGVPMDEYTMNIVINCYCLEKRVGCGFAVMGSFLKSGYEPDVATCNTLIKGLFLDDKVDDAVKLFKKILDLGICEQDDVMILTVIDGLCKAEQVIAARDLVRGIERSRRRLNVKVYSALLNGLSKGGMVDDALALLSEMAVEGVLPDVVPYNTLIDGYCLQGDMDKAIQVFNSLADTNLKPNIVCYNSLINGFCKKGLLDEAWIYFHEVPCKGLKHNTITYNSMIHGLFTKKRFADGWKLLEDMEVEGVVPDIFTYSILLDGLCQNGEIDKAVSLLHIIEQKGVNPNIVTYGTMIDGLCKNGKYEDATDIFNRLPSRGFQPNVWIYTMIMASLCRQGSVEEAICLLLEMESRGCAPNYVTYNTIFRGLLKNNVLHKVTPLLEVMYKNRLLSDKATFSMLLDQVRGQSDDDFLLKLMKNSFPRAIVEKKEEMASESIRVQS